jgi:hypothetical protein
MEILKLRISSLDGLDPETLELHLEFFRRGLALFASELLRASLDFRVLGNYVILHLEANVNSNETLLLKAILQNFFSKFLHSLRCEVLEDYIFLNIFYPITDSLAVNLFRLTNIFDTTTEIWRLGKFQRFLADVRSREPELARILERIPSRFDREVLRKIVRFSSEIRSYLLQSLACYPRIVNRLSDANISDLQKLLKRVDESGYDLVDLIKDLRNVAVHGFSSKNLMLERHLKAHFFELLREFELGTTLRDAFSLMLALELRMLLARGYLQPAPNSSSEH